MDPQFLELPLPVQRVARALEAKGITPAIRFFDQSTRTAQQAAEAIGCSIGQIVKSLVFVAGEEPFVALVSGANRVDLAKLETILGSPVRKANAEETKAATGFAIGGVPPLGHSSPLRVFLDDSLLEYEQVWAAAGHPHSVFPVAPADLARATGGEVVDLKEE